MHVDVLPMSGPQSPSHSVFHWQPGRHAIVLLRLYFGAWMLVNGLNHFVPIFPQPMGGPSASSQFMVTLIETGLFGVVKATEIMVGVLLLLDLFVPAALVVAMPISVVVWYNHAILSGRPFDISMGIGCLLWNIVLLIAYLRYFLPMLRRDAHVGTIADLRRVAEIGAPFEPTLGPPERQHRLVVTALGGLIAAALAYHLHPSTTLPPGAGKTPTRVVVEYVNLAYGPGARDQEAKRYLAPQLTASDSLQPNIGRIRSFTILSVVAQGSKVVLNSRVVAEQGGIQSEYHFVDFYNIVNSRIAEHSQVVAPGAQGS